MEEEGVRLGPSAQVPNTGGYHTDSAQWMQSLVPPHEAKPVEARFDGMLDRTDVPAQAKEAIRLLVADRVASPIELLSADPNQ